MEVKPPKKVVKFKVEPPLEGMQRVFVYGTLRMGGVFHHVLSDNGKEPAVFQGFARASGSLYADPERLIPFALGGALTPIAGEVWDVTPRIVKHMDQLESHPHLYRRIRTQIQMDGAAPYTKPEIAWLYWFQMVQEDAPAPDHWIKIEDGDFIAWLPAAKENRNLRWAVNKATQARQQLDYWTQEVADATREVEAAQIVVNGRQIKKGGA